MSERLKLDKGTYGPFPASLLKGKHPHEQTVLAWLWFHQNISGACFPSMKLLAEECSMSKRSILAAIAKLEESGLLARKPRTRGDGGRSTNQYDLFIDPYAGDAQGGAQEVHDPTQEVRTINQGKVTQGKDKPSLSSDEEDNPKSLPKPKPRTPPPVAPAPPSPATRTQSRTLSPELRIDAVSDARTRPTPRPTPDPPCKPKAVKVTWMTPYMTAWFAGRGGHLPADKNARSLRRFVKDYGEKAFPAWKRFCDTEDADYWPPHRFFREPMQWIKEPIVKQHVTQAW